jgi:anaerobic selenocysteine-containing dehydrogenase
MQRQGYRTCTLCEAMCGIVVEVEQDSEGERVGKIHGDARDPFSRGHICPKVMALSDLHHDEDRLRTPLKRTGAHFSPISWEQAFDEVACNLKRVQQSHGKSAVAVYQGNPTVHNSGTMLMSPLFVRSLRTKNRFSATSVDQLPHMLASYLMFGHQLLIPIPDIDRTDYMLVLGANPAVSNGSLMTAPGAADRLQAIIARGGKVVVLDPRRSETAALASEHHFIRPGSDALFLLAVLHTLFAEKHVRLGALASLVEGLDAVAAIAKRFAPERVAGQTGVSAETIKRIAHEFAGQPRAVCYGRVGVSTQEFGALSCWLINVLNIVSGNLDREGGAMFPQPAIDPLRLTAFFSPGHFATYHSRVRKLPEFSGELPVATLAEEIDTEGEGQIRALVTSAGNPVLSTPNGARLERALETLDYMVAIDFYLNETTRHAHIILPPSGPLEHDHYDLAFHLLAVRNTAKYAEALFERAPEARHDFEIFNELTLRMADTPRERLKARAQYLVLKKLGSRGILDILLRSGPYGDRFLPLRPRARKRALGLKEGLSIRALLAAPHGIDLGPLRPCLAQRLPKRHGRIVLAPSAMRQDLARLEESLVCAPASPQHTPPALVLIGRRHLRSNNSWLHNSPRLVRGPPRCTLQMHPNDAEARGLSKGCRVEVKSNVGAVEVSLEITDALMEGVVSLPHGFGHARPGTQLRIANAHAGASINDVTDDARVDLLSGNASFSGVPVSVRKVEDLGAATTA